MKRRLFLSRLAAASCAVAAFSVAGTAEAQVMLLGHQQPGYFEVNGSTEDCRKFVEAFQTHLWSDWRTHPNDHARRVIQTCYTGWPPGVGRVSRDGEQCREALRKTLAQFGSQINIVKYGM